ncbi:MAG: MBL fold metallo-hydrolase, partial [Chloroflexi bacterium]|nr:MBL fold metallo-hydrolase [Chloroflexota bacterium]
MNLPSNITFIQRGWVNSNSILISGGNGPVIVDTGHFLGTVETLQLITENGVNPAEIKLIVNTHCHWDHLGANAAIREMSGAQTAVSAATAHILQTNDRQAMWLDYFAADLIPIVIDLAWQDGDVVQLGQYEFEVIATPGHAPDSIALYQPDTRLLISADALHENDCGILNTAVHGEQILDEAIETVHKLQQRDIALALPGHGAPIMDAAGSLQTLANKLARFKTHPEKMALHLLRRVAMTTVLMQQPIHRDTLIEQALARPWPHDYALRAGFNDPSHMLNHLLDSFIRRELITEQEGILTSLVPR